MKRLYKSEWFSIIAALILWLCFALNTFGAKDIKDSFKYGTDLCTIGLVFDDTTYSAMDDYEKWIEKFFRRTGACIVKIDTSMLNDSLYDSTNEWDDLDLAVIAPFTGTALVDTSIEHGIGDVPLICYEESLWDDFGFPGVSSEIAADTIIVFSNNSYFTAVWSDSDTVIIASSGTGWYTFKGGASSYNILAYTLDKTDTLAILDTLNGVLRYAQSLGTQASGYTAIGLYDLLRIGQYNKSIFSSYIVNRIIANVSNAAADSIFNIVAFTYPYSGFLTMFNTTGAMEFINHLRSNGHRVSIIDTTYASSYPTFSYLGTTVAWDTIDFVVVGHGYHTSWLDSISVRNIPIFVVDPDIAKSSQIGFSGGTTSEGASDDRNKLRVETVASTVTKNFIYQDTLMFSTAADIGNGYEEVSWISSLSAGISLGSVILKSSDYTTWAVLLNSRKAFLGISSEKGLPTMDFFKIADSTFSWLVSSLPFPPTDVTVTPISIDSVQITWTDNEDSEDAYGVFLIDPDSTWWDNTLPANTETDTAYLFWPPNSRIIADVAVIEGTDTLFSSTGRDTAYTLASAPLPPITEAISDTALKYSLGQYEFWDSFSDSNFYSNPCWIDEVGEWQVDTLGGYLELKTDEGSNYIYSIYGDGNLIKDVDFQVSIQLCDTLIAVEQEIRYYVMQDDPAGLSGNGYFISLFGIGYIGFYKTNGTSNTLLIGSSCDMDYQWHDIKVERDWDSSPQDTTITWTLYFDGSSVGSTTDDTYLTSNGVALWSAQQGCRFDNVFVRGITPRANHPSTLYRINEANSNQDINYSTNQKQSGAVWGTYKQFGSAAGDTLQGLNPNTSYRFRVKAKNGR